MLIVFFLSENDLQRFFSGGEMFILLLNVVCVVADTISVDVERGRAQYELLKSDVRMPRYGQCWQMALDDLHNGSLYFLLGI
jgi:hypothetical protein